MLITLHNCMNIGVFTGLPGDSPRSMNILRLKLVNLSA